MDKVARLIFLQSDIWKEFRKKILENHNNTCDLCGQKYYGKLKKNLHVHHLHPKTYDDLDPDKFSLLCKPCHRFWHRILKRAVNKKYPIRNKGLWELMRRAITPDTLRNIDDSLDINQEGPDSGVL